MKTKEVNPFDQYYKTEIDKPNYHCLYSPMIKIRDEDTETKWLNLNQKSAAILIKKLKKEFNLK